MNDPQPQPLGKPTPGPDANDGEILRLATSLNSFVTDSIKFADQKASFILGLVTAVFALLCQAGLHRTWLHAPWPWSWPAWLTFSAFAADGLAGLLAIHTVLPRLKHASSTGIVYWRTVAKFGAPSEYAQAVVDRGVSGMAREMLEQCQVLSVVCSRKYAALNRALWLGGLGVALSLVAVVLCK
jgi:hypothetical protein